MAELSPPHALSNAGSLLEHRRISAVAKPQLYAIELLVRLPLLAVIPAHQSDLLGLDYNGLATAHTDASTVQSETTESNQRRLVDSCNNRAIDKLH